MARIVSIVVSLFAIFNLSIARDLPQVDYDAIIVGGGPAGLSALSALCRVSRRAVLLDSKRYRNNATRNMHDVIGADGMVVTLVSQTFVDMRLMRMVL